MADVFDNVDRMWFGTRDRMQWIETPRSGANVSTSGVSAEVDLISGGAFVRNSMDGHKNYTFSWGDSADRKLASIIRAYANGSYGRDLIHFQDPMYYETSVLPQRIADPSMAIGREAPDMTGDRFKPTGAPTAPNDHGLPVTSAFYSFPVNANLNTLRDGGSTFIPIPDGMDLIIGAYYTATGTAAIKIQADGSPSKVTTLPQHSIGDASCMTTIIRGAKYAELYLETGITGAACSMQIAGISARLRIATGENSGEGIPVTNLFTNPNLVGYGTWAEVQRNLFTNPNLVGDGTWAEVRKNLMTRPNPSLSLAGWQLRAGAVIDGGAVSDGRRLNVTAALTNGQYLALISANIPVVPGEVLSSSILMRNLSGSPVTLALQNWQVALGMEFAGPSAVIPAGEERELRIDHYVVPDGESRISSRIAAKGSIPIGVQVVVIDGWTVERANAPQGHFDGSTKPAGITQPEDFRTRWVGTANASESVLEIERVRGLSTPSHCIAGVSTKDGKPAARLIPLTTNTSSVASFPIPVSARALGTAIGTLHLDAPITGPVNSVAVRTVDATMPRQGSVQPPNVQGVYPLKASYADLASDYIMRLWHGGALGSGDVWWTDIGLFAGNYLGENFSGSAKPTDLVQPEDFRARWVGVVDNSESVLEIERVRGISTERCIAGVSTMSGRPAVRLIPLGSNPGLDTAATFIVPISARTLGTLMGTVHVPLGANTDHALSYTTRVQSPTFSTLRTPAGGVHRNTFGPLASQNNCALYGGLAIAGSGDTWWTDIGLFAGSYDGPIFSGDSSNASWNGAPNDSTSTYIPPVAGELGDGYWYAGEGSSGCRFVGKPTVYNNDGINGGHVSLACELRETGAWE